VHPTALFRDRADGGRQLASLLAEQPFTNAVVLALPRGGVPVGFEVARALGLPLDIVIVRKLGAPGQPELGMGAVAEGGAIFLDPEIVESVGASLDEVQEVIAHERAEIVRRVSLWRGGRPPLDLAGATAVVVDDGIATGGTVRAALHAVRERGARRVVVAVPVAATSALDALDDEADDVVCVHSLAHLGSVGRCYDDFTQVDDGVVPQLLARARAALARTSPHTDGR
jgi:putative phosphoribosyl transferase